jgi:hypothetical protein
MLQISKPVNDFQVALSAEIEPVAGESEDQMMFSRTLRP